MIPHKRRKQPQDTWYLPDSQASNEIIIRVNEEALRVLEENAPKRKTTDRVFVGEFRQSASEFFGQNGPGSFAGIVVCRCGANLGTREDIWEHYTRGHFDQPVYQILTTGEYVIGDDGQ